MSNEMRVYQNKLKENIKKLIEKNKLIEANEILSQYEKIVKDDVDIYSIKGVIAMMEGDINKAERIFKEGLLTDPENFDLNYNLAYLYKSKSHQTESIKQGEVSKKLHIGCGRNILDEWINLDLMGLPGVDIIADLDACMDTPLPLEDNTIEEFYASHIIEHINNPLAMMEELHRVAKPNAKAIFRCPYGSTDEAFEDPTHVKQYFLNSFGYFSQPFYWRADYGYRGDWLTEKITLIVDKKTWQGKSSQELLEIVNRYRNVVKEMIVELKAIKPIRVPKKELQTAPKIEIVLN